MAYPGPEDWKTGLNNNWAVLMLSKWFPRSNFINKLSPGSKVLLLLAPNSFKEYEH